MFRVEEAALRSLVWVDRRGEATPTTATRAVLPEVAVSPTASDRRRDRCREQRHLAPRATSGALTRLTFEHENSFPRWAPDGRLSLRVGPTVPSIRTDAGGRTQIRRLMQSPRWATPTSVSPDGAMLLFDQVGEEGASKSGGFP